MTDDATLLRVLVLTQLAKNVKAVTDEARADAADTLPEGATQRLRSPLDGTKLGTVSKTDPEPVAEITDRRALDEWITTRHPEKVETVTVISGSDAEVRAVLAEHAPHLLSVQRHVPDWVANEVVLASKQAGQPCAWGELDVPGVAVTKKPGVLTVRPDPKTAPAAVAAMWEAHLISQDGTVRALPGMEGAA